MPTHIIPLTGEGWSLPPRKRGMGGEIPAGKTMIPDTPPTLASYIPSGSETGAALALRDGERRFLFFIAGTRVPMRPRRTVLRRNRRTPRTRRRLANLRSQRSARRNRNRRRHPSHPPTTWRITAAGDVRSDRDFRQSPPRRAVRDAKPAQHDPLRRRLSHRHIPRHADRRTSDACRRKKSAP